ncbi:Transcription factor bHLH19, partial [Mucuna pruriens]
DMDGDNCFFNQYQRNGEGSETQTGNINMEATVGQGTKRAKTSSDTLNHIMSERKRRQQMAERFIALSAVIPGLNKIDKASVLGEAINHVKQLQGRIAVLEQCWSSAGAVLEQESKKKSTKLMIFSKKSQSHPCSPSCENSNYFLESNHVLPQVEAIGLELEKKLLIRILSVKRKGILLKLLASLENTHLSIISSSLLPFGKNTLSITIITQMGEEYNMTVEELVKSLTQDLRNLSNQQERARLDC